MRLQKLPSALIFRLMKCLPLMFIERFPHRLIMGHDVSHVPSTHDSYCRVSHQRDMGIEHRFGVLEVSN